MNEKIKLIFINGGVMDRGGISGFLVNYLTYFDFDKFSVDILVHGSETGVRDEFLKNIGCKIIKISPKSKGYSKWKSSITDIFKMGHYDIVHCNADSGNGPILKVAKACKIPVRISHSHNTEYLSYNKVKILLNYVQKRMIPKYATELFACSNAAGMWLYNNYRFTVIPNAINYDKYSFNKTLRDSFREQLQIPNDQIVVGHIGRFDYQKNHKFIIEIIEKCKNDNILFILLGDGHLKQEFETKINSKGLSSNVNALGEVDNVFEYLNCFDVFILPSLFEGLSVVSIEAQINGLPCLFSDTITPECLISENSQFLSIESSSIWHKKILGIKKETINRERKLNNNTYNIIIQSECLQTYYMKVMEGYK